MALIALPRILKNFNLYIDGVSYAGRCDTVQPPNIVAVVEAYRGAGMGGPVEIGLGLDLMTMQLTISDFDPDLISLFNSTDLPVTLRGSVQSQSNKAEAVIINTRGLFKGFNFGAWQNGTKSPQTVDYSLKYFRYRQKDVEYAEIDFENMIQKIGGVDQLADDRSNIGL